MVAVPPKALQALLLLVCNPGKLIERETLIEAIWADTCVEDANLTVAISQLRKVLGQSGDTPEYVATVARAGYRFIPDVREVREAPAMPLIEPRAPPVVEEPEVPIGKEPAPLAFQNPRPSRELIEEQGSTPSVRRTWPWPIAAFGIVAVMGAGTWAFRGSNDTRAIVARPRSLAVLPLKSFIGGTADEELRLRITDALITRLGNVNGISVRPTTSILTFARGNTETRDAGRQLSVDAVLDGRIQTEGERVRVTLQLVSVGTGETLWSGQFDGATNGTLDLQDQIAAQLLPRLAHQAGLGANSTTNAAAYELYLKGRYLWNKRTAEGSRGAIEYFDQAIALDSSFALAYTGLADAYSMLANDGNQLSRDEGYAQAKRMAEQALAIDPGLSEAYAALGWILTRHEFNFAAADQAFARAIALNPSNADAYHWRALNFLALGRTDEYLAAMETARQLAPLTRPLARNYYDVVLTKGGCAKAFEYLERFHALYDPSEGERIELFGRHHVLCREYERGLAILTRIPTERISLAARAYLAVAYARAGRRQEALDILKRFRADFYLRSYIHVALGEFDAAFVSLEKAIDEREGRCVRLKYDLLLAPLRADARFSKLLARVNLPG
ncbi:MAG: winged helix-turn-helix domain-containing protein [Vicinamibacterales bacterium]